MVSLVVELSEYEIQYALIGSIKSQALTDFMVELRSLIDNKTPLEWVLSIYATSNVKGSYIGIVLEGSDKILIKQTLKFESTANIN